MADRVDGIALGCIAAGGGLLYAGIRGKSIPSLLTGFIQGKSPAKAASANPITQVVESGGGTVVTGTGGTATGEQLAAYDLAWSGHAYGWGGAPGPNGLNPWDCSSMQNYVVGVQGRLAIPGYAAGAYDGSVHGPDTTVWLVTSLCTTIQVNSYSQADPGDLIVGVTHMGMYTGNGNYMSAHDPADGTSNTPLEGGFPDPVYLVRRLNAVTAGG